MTRSSVESHRRRSWRAGRLVCGLAAVLAVMAAVPAARAQVTPWPTTPGPLTNPGLKGECGQLKVMLVLDESQSIRTLGAVAAVQNAARAFVEGLADTGTQVAITSFSTTARNGVVPYREVTTGQAGTLGDFQRWIGQNGQNGQQVGGNAGYNPSGFTNWQDGLEQVNRVSRTFGVPAPDLVVFVTDGDPNRAGNGAQSTTLQAAMNSAVTTANQLKTAPVSALPSGQAGSHIFAVGVGPAGHPGSDQERRVAAISGTRRFPDLHSDFATADYTLATNFDDLKASLTRIVVGLCGSSLEITKYERAAGDTAWREANGWTFTATLAPPPAHRWLTPNPPGAEPSRPSATETTGTQPSGSDGMAVFGWKLTTAGTSRLSVVRERSKPGFRLVWRKCQVHERESNGTLRVRRTQQGTRGSIATALTVPLRGWVTCRVFNRQKGAHLQVQKRLIPGNDPGRFDLLVNGSPERVDVGDGGSTQRLVLPLGRHTVSERAAEGTRLDGYSTSTRCVNLTTGKRVAAGVGTESDPVPVRLRRETDDILCTITNTSRTHGNLTVIKHLLPPGDPGRFDLLITKDGVPLGREDNVTDGGSLGPVRLPFGTYEVSEEGAGHTVLSQYIVHITCIDESTGGTVSSQIGPSVSVTLHSPNVACTITNQHHPGAGVGFLTLSLRVVPSDDPGLFDLRIDGHTLAPEVGDGGSTSRLAVDPGPHHVGVRVTASQRGVVSLADYSIKTRCRRRSPRESVEATGPEPVRTGVTEAEKVACVIALARRKRPPGPGEGGDLPPGPCPDVDAGLAECPHAAAAPRLILSKRMPARTRVGHRVPITITVENVGRGTAHDVRVQETSRHGGRIVSVADRGSRQGHGSVVWRLGDLAPGKRRTVHATLVLTRTGVRMDTAVATAGDADPAFDFAAVRARRRPRPHTPPPPVTG